MRFEIGAWGIFLILVGLTGLSGSVFLLGMFAGYEVARQDQQSSTVAMELPVPTNPPISSPSPVEPGLSGQPSTSPSGVASTAAVNGPGISGARPLPPVIATRSTMMASPTATPTSEGPTVAGLTTPSLSAPSKSVNPPQSASVASPSGNPPARPSTASPAAAHIGPYSVEIQAAMDSQAAQQLVQKLRSLGYPAYAVPKQINGQTWYKVRVGHFASREEAEAAEERLHQQFNGSFPTR